MLIHGSVERVGLAPREMSRTRRRRSPWICPHDESAGWCTTPMPSSMPSTGYRSDLVVVDTGASLRRWCVPASLPTPCGAGTAAMIPGTGRTFGLVIQHRYRQSGRGTPHHDIAPELLSRRDGENGTRILASCAGRGCCRDVARGPTKYLAVP